MFYDDEKFKLQYRKGDVSTSSRLDICLTLAFVFCLFFLACFFSESLPTKLAIKHFATNIYNVYDLRHYFVGIHRPSEILASNVRIRRLAKPTYIARMRLQSGFFCCFRLTRFFFIPSMLLAKAVCQSNSGNFSLGLFICMYTWGWENDLQV